jgi:hypothetical protein
MNYQHIIDRIEDWAKNETPDVAVGMKKAIAIIRAIEYEEVEEYDREMDKRFKEDKSWTEN